MTILFDLLCAQPTHNGTKYHGGGEYAKTVLAEIIRQKKDETIIVFFDHKRFMDEWIKVLLNENGIVKIDVSDYIQLSSVFNEYPIDTYYSAMPYYDLNSIIPSNVRKVGTIHGLRLLEKNTDTYEYYFANSFYERFKALVKPMAGAIVHQKWLNKYYQYIKGLDYVVCVSNHTHYAIKVFFPQLERNLFVYYTPCKYLEKMEISNPVVDGKYILIIGGNRWEKNVVRAIKAVDGLIEKGFLSEYRIVIVGTLTNKIEKMIKHKTRFTTMGYVASELLENLYMFCDIFLYVSLNEGFGMPPLEAMKYGKTCVVSGVCSLPEVCGNAAYYVNPYDIFEIQNRILMATERKIPMEVVLNHVTEMQRRQENDLYRLAKFILDSSKAET